MSIVGSGVADSNARLRFLIFVFLSTIVFGTLLFWREKYIYSQDYVELPAPNAHTAKESLRSSSHGEEVRKELNK